jgi:hypothetical protein
MFPTEWQGMHVPRLSLFTTRLTNRPIPCPWTAPSNSTTNNQRSLSDISSLTSPIWYMEINLESVDEPSGSADTSASCVFSFGIVRLPASGRTFNLDEHRAMLADTGTGINVARASFNPPHVPPEK